MVKLCFNTTSNVLNIRADAFAVRIKNCTRICGSTSLDTKSRTRIQFLKGRKRPASKLSGAGGNGPLMLQKSAKS
jgi:hypothetical protein